jgi:hypothetical protein
MAENASPPSTTATRTRRRWTHTAPPRGPTSPLYRPRRPTATPLYPVVQHHLETFLATAEEAEPLGNGIPWWVEKDFRDHASRGARLRCGMTSASLRRASGTPRSLRRLRHRAAPPVFLSRKGRVPFV